MVSDLIVFFVAVVVGKNDNVLRAAVTFSAYDHLMNISKKMRKASGEKKFIWSSSLRRG